jgi:hypothetical protein
LVLGSFGIVLAQACGLTTVAVTLASLLGCSEMTIRERLRDWYRDGRDKSILSSFPPVGHVVWVKNYLMRQSQWLSAGTKPANKCPPLTLWRGWGVAPGGAEDWP